MAKIVGELMHFMTRPRLKENQTVRFRVGKKTRFHYTDTKIVQYGLKIEYNL